MQNLTGYFKSLRSLHKEKRKDALNFLFLHSKNTQILQPVIEKQEELENLEYSLEFKNLQENLKSKMKDFLYLNKQDEDIISVIIEINNKLIKSKNYKISCSSIQNVLNNNIRELINRYVKYNLLISSYIKDILTLSKKGNLSSLEKNEITSIRKKIHKLLLNEY